MIGLIRAASSQPPAPEVGAAPSLAPAPEIAGRAILFEDTSRSMLAEDLPGVRAERRALLEELKGRVGSSHVQIQIAGTGTDSGGPEQNLLNTWAANLPEHGVAELVLVFSDFEREPRPLHRHTDEGLDRLRDRIERGGLRLYLATVQDDPDPRLAGLAVSSGGGVLRLGPAAGPAGSPPPEGVHR